MNRNILIAVVLLSLGAGRAVVAQETKPGKGLDWNSFQAIGQKNIFDPTRSGRSGTKSVRRVAVVRTFTFNGTIDDTAWFTGSGVPEKGYLKAGETLNGFKLMKIPVRYTEPPTAIFTDPAGAIVVLKESESMRREEDGPWLKSDQPAPLVIVNPETKADETTAASSAAPAGESDVLKRLRLKREQEEK